MNPLKLLVILCEVLKSNLRLLEGVSFKTLSSPRWSSLENSSSAKSVRLRAGLVRRRGVVDEGDGCADGTAGVVADLANITASHAFAVPSAEDLLHQPAVAGCVSGLVRVVGAVPDLEAGFLPVAGVHVDPMAAEPVE